MANHDEPEILFTVNPPTPSSIIAKIPSISFVGGLDGRFDLTLLLQDGGIPLISGDTVNIKVYDQGNSLLEEIQGGYGLNISTYTSVVLNNTQSVISWLSGTVADAGILQFAKKQYASNNFISYLEGSWDGVNYTSNAQQLTFEITATNVGGTSNNIDNTNIVERVVDMVQAFTGILDGNPNPFSLYTMDDVNSKYYNSMSSIDLKLDGITILSTVPSLSRTDFSWGSRNIFSSNALATTSDSEYIINTVFTNGMQTSANMFTKINGREVGSAYNMRLGGSQIADTFIEKIESTILPIENSQRAVLNINFYNLTFPVALSDVYLDGILTYASVPYVQNIGTGVSETDWFDIPFTFIGQRRTIRVEYLEGTKATFNNYQLEMNYVY